MGKNQPSHYIIHKRKTEIYSQTLNTLQIAAHLVNHFHIYLFIVLTIKLYRCVLEYVLYTVHSMHELELHIGLTVPVNIKSIINTVSK